MSQFDEDLQALLRKTESTNAKAEAFIAALLNIVESYTRNADHNLQCLQKAVAVELEHQIKPPVPPVPLHEGATPASNGQGGDPRTAMTNLRRQGLQ